MNTAQSTDRSPAVVANKPFMREDCSLEFDALMIHITQEDIGNYGHQQRGGNW